MIKSKLLSKYQNISHGFFNKLGGYSDGIYKSLNCGVGSNDKKNNINKNLKKVCKKISCARNKLVLLNQIHSNKVFSINKIPKKAKDTEIILLSQKVSKTKEIKQFIKSVFSNKLFSEQNFLAKDYNEKSYIFVNCTKSKVALDFEKLGSKLYVFLKENKKENSFINLDNNTFTNVQLEKFLHGAQLKSYSF